MKGLLPPSPPDRDWETFFAVPRPVPLTLADRLRHWLNPPPPIRPISVYAPQSQPLPLSLPAPLSPAAQNPDPDDPRTRPDRDHWFSIDRTDAHDDYGIDDTF